MHVVWDDCGFAASAPSRDGGLSAVLAGPFRAAAAKLRAQWATYAIEAALRDADPHILTDIGVRRAGSGRISALHD